MSFVICSAIVSGLSNIGKSGTRLSAGVRRVDSGGALNARRRFLAVAAALGVVGLCTTTVGADTEPIASGVERSAANGSLRLNESSSDPTSADLRAAGAAVRWLESQLATSTPLLTFGSADWPTTVQAGLALAAAGAAPAVTEPLWASVVAHRESTVTRSGADNPGRLAFVVLLASALGKDPRSVGSQPGANLVQRLQSTRRLSGVDAGLFGDQIPTFDGAYRQGLALLALHAAGETIDPSSVSWIATQQCGSGGWAGYRPVPSPCASSGATAADSNSTALAVSALSALKLESTRVTAGVTWLDDHQTSDGGWLLTERSSQSDPDSTALVIQALVASGAVDDARFADKPSPFQALRAFQLGCSAEPEDQGAFTYPGSNGASNTLATIQAIPALTRHAFPVNPSAPSVAAVDLCASTTTTSTSTTTTSMPDASTTSTTPTVPSTTIVASTTTVVLVTTTLATTTSSATSVAPATTTTLPSSVKAATVVRSRSSTANSLSGTTPLATTGSAALVMATVGLGLVAGGMLVLVGGAFGGRREPSPNRRRRKS